MHFFWAHSGFEAFWKNWTYAKWCFLASRLRRPGHHSWLMVFTKIECGAQQIMCFLLQNPWRQMGDRHPIHPSVISSVYTDKDGWIHSHPLNGTSMAVIPAPCGMSGLSNWRLDPAKMNRSVCLARPDPDSAEVGRTGHGAQGPLVVVWCWWVPNIQGLGG